MRLFIDGHNAKRGYALALTWSDAECRQLPPATDGEMRPVRFIASKAKAEALVARFNRRYATH